MTRVLEKKTTRTNRLGSATYTKCQLNRLMMVKSRERIYNHMNFKDEEIRGTSNSRFVLGILIETLNINK